MFELDEAPNPCLPVVTNQNKLRKEDRVNIRQLKHHAGTAHAALILADIGRLPKTFLQELPFSALKDVFRTALEMKNPLANQAFLAMARSANSLESYLIVYENAPKGSPAALAAFESAIAKAANFEDWKKILPYGISNGSEQVVIQGMLQTAKTTSHWITFYTQFPSYPAVLQYMVLLAKTEDDWYSIRDATAKSAPDVAERAIRNMRNRYKGTVLLSANKERIQERIAREIIKNPHSEDELIEAQCIARRKASEDPGWERVARNGFRKLVRGASFELLLGIERNTENPWERGVVLRRLECEAKSFAGLLRFLENLCERVYRSQTAEQEVIQRCERRLLNKTKTARTLGSILKRKDCWMSKTLREGAYRKLVKLAAKSS